MGDTPTIEGHHALWPDGPHEKRERAPMTTVAGYPALVSRLT